MTMDISFIIVIWVVVSIIQAVAERKKAPPPPEFPPQDSIDFEIPTLANDPTISAEVEEISLTELYRQKKLEQSATVQPVAAPEPEVEEKKLELDLTPESAVNAIVMSEILGKPKALRRK